MSSICDRTQSRGRWLVLSICVLAGLAYLGIGLGTGNTGFGLTGLAIMLCYAAVLAVFGRRSEAVGLLAGSGSDERRTQIQLRASAATGHVLVVVLVGWFLWALAAGSSYANVLAALCAVGGVSYVAATVWFSRRG